MGFEGKKVLVMGAVNGTLVAKALQGDLISNVIASRTYERAVKLAGQLCGKAVKLTN